MPPVLSEYLDPGVAPLQSHPLKSAKCGALFAHFNPCHEGKQYLPPEVKWESFSREVLLQYLTQSTKGSELVEESFVNSNFGESSTGMSGFIQTRYLPSDRMT